MSGRKIIKVPARVSLVVVGDIHEHPEQFFKIVSEAKIGQSNWLVSVGDVYDKGFGAKAAENITDALIEMNIDNMAYAVRGNHELKQIKRSKYMSKQLKWWANCPLVLMFQFPNGTNVTVVHAGIEPNKSFEDLGNSVDVCYVREVDETGKMIPLVWEYNQNTGIKSLVQKRQGKLWHELYDGRFGYVISGHISQKNGQPKYFPYSCNIDTGVYDTGILTGQIIKNNGALGGIIQVTGEAYKPIIEGEVT